MSSYTFAISPDSSESSSDVTSESSSSSASILMDLLAVVILVKAAVLLALCERVLIVAATIGTELDGTSSSEEASSSRTRLLERGGGLVERGAGVCGIETAMSRFKSRSNLPTTQGVKKRIDVYHMDYGSCSKMGHKIQLTR